LSHASQEIESEIIASLSSLSAFSYSQDIGFARNGIGNFFFVCDEAFNVFIKFVESHVEGTRVNLI